MTIPLNGTVKVSDCRAEVDIAPQGLFTDPAVLNSANKEVGPLAISELRGNVLGLQLRTANSDTSWAPHRAWTTGHQYLAGAPNISISGNAVNVPCTGNGNFGDTGIEARCVGKITESGTYRLSGAWLGDFTNNKGNGVVRINLIANQSGYLQGAQALLINEEYGVTTGSGHRNASWDVAIATTYPFITLVLGNLKYGFTSDGTGGFETTTHMFHMWRLRRVS